MAAARATVPTDGMWRGSGVRARADEGEQRRKRAAAAALAKRIGWCSGLTTVPAHMRQFSSGGHRGGKTEPSGARCVREAESQNQGSSSHVCARSLWCGVRRDIVSIVCILCRTRLEVFHACFSVESHSSASTAARRDFLPRQGGGADCCASARAALDPRQRHRDAPPRPRRHTVSSLHRACGHASCTRRVRMNVTKNADLFSMRATCVTGQPRRDDH